MLLQQQKKQQRRTHIPYPYPSPTYNQYPHRYPDYASENVDHGKRRETFRHFVNEKLKQQAMMAGDGIWKDYGVDCQKEKEVVGKDDWRKQPIYDKCKGANNAFVSENQRRTSRSFVHQNEFKQQRDDNQHTNLNTLYKISKLEAERAKLIEQNMNYNGKDVKPVCINYEEDHALTIRKENANILQNNSDLHLKYLQNYQKFGISQFRQPMRELTNMNYEDGNKIKQIQSTHQKKVATNNTNNINNYPQDQRLNLMEQYENQYQSKLIQNIKRKWMVDLKQPQAIKQQKYKSHQNDIKALQNKYEVFKDKLKVDSTKSFEVQNIVRQTYKKPQPRRILKEKKHQNHSYDNKDESVNKSRAGTSKKKQNTSASNSRSESQKKCCLKKNPSVKTQALKSLLKNKECCTVRHQRKNSTIKNSIKSEQPHIKQWNKKIQRRLSVNLGLFVDSEHRNSLHEKQHLDNSYLKAENERKQIREKIIKTVQDTQRKKRLLRKS